MIVAAALSRHGRSTTGSRHTTTGSRHTTTDDVTIRDVLASRAEVWERHRADRLGTVTVLHDVTDSWFDEVGHQTLDGARDWFDVDEGPWTAERRL